METLTRGKLAKRSGVNIETLRYYEKRNLIDPPRRSEAGYRLYTPADILRIRFIKNAQKLGFTLKEIRELLKLRIKINTSCDSVLKKAEHKRAEIMVKIKDLNLMKRALDQLIHKCEESIPTKDCPILESFESNKKS
ncbi:MAG: heavy metal-responsive transcriptional regulator [Nitrospinae bacterium]|nr:heavy metal-responsive transcriptional regulator [Nitrospinota bacterium]MCH7498769.1 heavy metal-responsive transcriptional regulator [Nitrospinota bacterium]